MSHYVYYNVPGGPPVMVEISEEPLATRRAPSTHVGVGGEVLASAPRQVAETVEKSTTTFEAALGPLDGCISAFVAMMRRVQPQPESVELAFGLRASAEVGGAFFITAKGMSEANFAMKIIWKREPEAPEAPPSQVPPKA